MFQVWIWDTIALIDLSLTQESVQVTESWSIYADC